MFVLALSYREPSLKETEFYAPSKTAELHNTLYKMCLEEHSKFNTDGLIHDLTSFDYLDTFSKLAHFYKYHGTEIGDLYRAIDIYKILQSYPQYEESSFENLIDIYRWGPLTIRSPLTALDMWKKKLTAGMRSPHYLHLLQRIAEFCKNTGFFGEERTYRSQLIQLLGNNPEGQALEFERLAQITEWHVPEMVLQIRDIARKTLTSLFIAPLRLRILGILSEVYKRYPGFASPGEIVHITNEIAHSMPVIDVDDTDEVLDWED
jgi:hypothetical protein